MVLDFPVGSSPIIKVNSKSTDIEFVKVSVKEILNPGTPSEKEVEADMTDSSSIIISPQKFALTPGTTRSIRAITMMAPKKEKTWRVSFQGVTADGYNELPVSNGKKLKVGINIIWAVLVHSAPAQKVASITFDPSANALVNTGTVRLPITAIGVCKSNSDCIWTKNSSVIYPGMKKIIKVQGFTSDSFLKVSYIDWLSNNAKREIKAESL